MQFQVVSDIHTEFYSIDSPYFPQITPAAPYLIIAGDLGIPIFAKDRYVRFLVAGNHEFYKSTIQETKEAMTDIFKQYDNVYFLDKTRHDIGDVTILGCVLWSNVIESQKLNVREMLQDYVQINNFTVEHQNQLHRDELLWLQSEIRGIDRNRKIVVVTHHAPLLTGTSHPQYDNSPITSAFATDLSMMLREPIKVWVYGHTHFSSDQMKNGVRILSNQLGYPFENNTGYRLWGFEI